MCVLMCNSCAVQCIDKVTEGIPVLNMFAVVFAVIAEDLQIWWKSMRTRFGKLTGHCSRNGTCELMDLEKYILKKLQFLERHIACEPSRQTCSISIKLINQHTSH